jgi:hypothetical protein
MCATLHRNSTIAAPARTSRLGATAWRQPFGDPPGQGRWSPVRFDRSRVDRGRSSKLFLLISPESPSGLALPNRDQPRSPVCASAGPEPSPSNPGSAITPPTHPIRLRRPAPRSGQVARSPWASAAPKEGIRRISMTKSSMTTPTPGIPMARAHPFRGASPWPNQPRSGQGTRSTQVAPSCPLPRRTAGGPGRPAPTWEELLGQR